MPHVMLGGIVHQGAVGLSRRLARLTLGDDAMCFFSESGSVAVEVALKIAVQYGLIKARQIESDSPVSKVPITATPPVR